MRSVLFYILYSSSFLVALLPLRVLYAISDFFYYIIYYIIKYRKKTVITNLRNSFPGKSHSEIKTIAKKFYRHLCDLFVETLKLLHLPEKERKKRFKLRNPEILEGLYANHKLILVALGHYNNWEWLATVTQKPGFQVASIYKPLHTFNFDRFMYKIRSKWGCILVTTTNTIRFLNSWNNPDLRTFLCFISDQSPMKKDIHYWTNFLNQETPIFIGIEKIAVKMNLPVGFLRIHKIKRGYYELEIVPITEEPTLTKPFEITEAHVRLLEEDIIRKPEYWLWSHRRWKRQLVNNEIIYNHNA